VVFCSLRDTIIALDAVGRRIPPDRLVLYNGGHELYSSSSRESIRPRLIQVLKKA
jgi:hypothetical protein